MSLTNECNIKKQATYKIFCWIFILMNAFFLISCGSDPEKEITTGKKILHIYQRHEQEYVFLKTLLEYKPTMPKSNVSSNSSMAQLQYENMRLQQFKSEIQQYGSKLTAIQSQIKVGFFKDVENELDSYEKKILLKKANQLSAKKIKDINHINYLNKEFIQKIIVNLTGDSNEELFTPLPLRKASSDDINTLIEEDNKIATKIADTPNFAKTTTQPVKLRYKFQKGQQIPFSVTFLTNSNTIITNQKVAMRMLFSIKGKYDIISINSNGDAEVNMTTTHLTMKGIIQNDQYIYYNSNDTDCTSHPKFKPLTNLINLEIGCKISSLGKVLDVDQTIIHKISQEAASVAFSDDIEKTINQMINSTFVQLNKEPVIMGETYDAGILSWQLEKIGVMKMHVTYTIKAVSEDMKMAVLSPTTTVKIENMVEGISSVNVDNQKTDGWILFDLENGIISRSAGKQRYSLTISTEDKQEAKIAISTLISFNE